VSLATTDSATIRGWTSATKMKASGLSTRKNLGVVFAVLAFLWIIYLRQSILQKIDSLSGYSGLGNLAVENPEIESAEDDDGNDGIAVDDDEVTNETEDDSPVLDPSDRQDDSVEVDSFRPIKSIPYSGTVRGRVIKNPGVPPDAFRWKSDYSSIKTNMDLPRILPRTAANWNESMSSKITVCVFNRAPRQRSLWATDVLGMFGSGKYHYQSMEATDCQFFGTCRTPRESRLHDECDPQVSPTVGLVEWVKCCFHDRFTKAIRTQGWDVAVATGDEYCASNDASGGKADFRFYYGVNTSRDGPKPGVYLPLGPREEFRRVKPQHVILASQRGYLFNFVGSLTSRSRRILAGVLRRGVNPSGKESFLHVIGSWSKEATRQNGYILPHEYRKVLLNSTFTLCPDGHNPEAYRIYEALEAGSIPILALDEYYLSHECQHAFAPLLESGAPMVYLNSWTGLRPFLNMVHNKPELLIKMQADAMAWYSKWMRMKAMEFEKVMEKRFTDRKTQG